MNEIPNHSSSTASGAGNSCGSRWTAARDQEVRMEELLHFLQALVDKGLVTRNDEMASARRTLQHLTGQSGKGSLRQDLKERKKNV